MTGSVSLPQISEDSQRQPIQNRQIRNDGYSDASEQFNEGGLNRKDFNKMYQNDNEEQESNNVQEMLKHGNKGYVNQLDGKNYAAFNSRQPFGGEVIETSKEGHSSIMDARRSAASGFNGRPDEPGSAAQPIDRDDPESPKVKPRYN